VTTYLPPDAPPLELIDRPLLASWDRHDHPSQVRLRAYLERLIELVAPAIARIEGPTALQLDVGLGPNIDLLHQRDLDNYLQPLADALPSSVCSYWATKSTATTSTVTVGLAVSAGAHDLDGWSSARATTAASLSGSAGKHAINVAIEATASITPDGPLELQVVFAIGEDRNWRPLWKPAIDALDPILGRTQPDRPFHPRDDRIVRLGLHRRIQTDRGAATSLDVYWRPAAGVDVGKPSPPMRRAQTPSPVRRDVRKEPPVTIDGITIFDHDDEGYERWLHEHATGFVVNAARNPKPDYLKVHTASCQFITSPSFRGSSWTSSDYVKVCSDDRPALDLWARQQVGGSLDAGCSCH
jgi:hypothetical protein